MVGTEEERIKRWWPDVNPFDGRNFVQVKEYEESEEGEDIKYWREGEALRSAVNLKRAENSRRPRKWSRKKRLWQTSMQMSPFAV